MALETGVTYIDDLVDTNPVGATDNIDEGDDHIRNIKTAVQGSFPSLGAAAVTKTAAEINDAVDVAQSGKILLNTKVVEIGTWDMDVTGFLDVAHGLTLSKIRAVIITIRDDTDAYRYVFPSPHPSATSGELVRTDATNVRMYRGTAGQFDNTSFDTMGDDGNRGWIIVKYAD